MVQRWFNGSPLGNAPIGRPDGRTTSPHRLPVLRAARRLDSRLPLRSRSIRLSRPLPRSVPPMSSAYVTSAPLSGIELCANEPPFA